MSLKAEQQRLKALLKDTITLLCKNGLAFKKGFSIDALIGVTLDEDNVLLVSINESVKIAKDGDSMCESIPRKTMAASKHKRTSSPNKTETPSRKRANRSVKAEASFSHESKSSCDIDNDNNGEIWNEPVNALGEPRFDILDNTCSSQHSFEQTPAAVGAELPDSGTIAEENHYDGEGRNKASVVVVKQEPDEDYGTSFSQHTANIGEMDQSLHSSMPGVLETQYSVQSTGDSEMKAVLPAGDIHTDWPDPTQPSSSMNNTTMSDAGPNQQVGG